MSDGTLRKYEVAVSVTAMAWIEVEAEDEDDARDQAIEEVKNPFVDWDIDNDYVVQDVTEVPPGPQSLKA